MDISEIATFIKSIPIFRGLEQENVESLATICHIKKFPDKEMICEENSKGDTLYMILSGEVIIQKTIAGGKKLDLATLMPRNIFGEMSMLANIPRSADVVAKGSVELLELTAADFRSLIISDQWTALRFVYELARMLCWRLKKLDDKFTEHMTCSNAPQKEIKNFMAFKEKLLKDLSF